MGPSKPQNRESPPISGMDEGKAAVAALNRVADGLFEVAAAIDRQTQAGQDEGVDPLDQRPRDMAGRLVE
jgi:hypothetical protein